MNMREGPEMNLAEARAKSSTAPASPRAAGEVARAEGSRMAWREVKGPVMVVQVAAAL